MGATMRALKKQCIIKYRELWGNDWVEERYTSIGTSESPAENGIFEYDIDQSDSLLEKPSEKKIVFSHTPPQHSTTFKCNLNTGTVEILSHY